MKLPQENNQEPKSPEKATRKRSRLVRYSVSAFVVLLGALLLGFVALRVVTATIARDSVVDKPISDVLNMADQHKLKTALIQGNEVFATSSTGQNIMHTRKMARQSQIHSGTMESLLPL